MPPENCLKFGSPEKSKVRATQPNIFLNFSSKKVYGTDRPLMQYKKTILKVPEPERVLYFLFYKPELIFF